jgi:hypothetical protein
VKRRLTQFLFALGLLLTLAAAALWVRGFWATHQLRVVRQWENRDDYHEAHVYFHVSAWTCGVDWVRRKEPEAAPIYRGFLVMPRWHVSHEVFPPTPPRLRGGFELSNDKWDDGVSFDRSASIPTWLLLTITVAVTALPARALRRARQRATSDRLGLCLACGYDLRGAAHERCPECGVAISGAVDAPARV